MPQQQPGFDPNEIDFDDEIPEGADRGDDFPGGDEGTPENSPPEVEEAAGEEPDGDDEPEPEGDEPDGDEPEDGEEEGESESDDAPVDRKPPGMVPNFRYNSMRDRLQSRIDELEKQLTERNEPVRPAEPQGPSYEEQMAEVSANLATALAEGDKDKIAQHMAAQQKLQDARYQQLLDQVVNTSATRSREETRYDTRLAQIEAEYPQLNIDSDRFDEELAQEMVDLRDAYVAKGHSVDKALDKAFRFIQPMIDSEGVAAAAQATREEAKKQNTGRKAAAVKRNIDAAKRQPPAQTGGKDHNKAGSGGEAVDVMNMTEEEFDALPESVLRQYRGDMV